jgi:NAD(P)-dependent dehydrogenase (short-subunit alcohol dehydrogenase family)
MIPVSHRRTNPELKEESMTTTTDGSEYNSAVRSLSDGVSLAGQVALITGGSRGIGRGISTTVARAGAAVSIIARGREALDSARRAIEDDGGRVIAIQGDVGDPEAVRDAVAQTAEQLGPIDLLVNNAGVDTSIGDCAEVDPKPWWDDVTVNLRAPMLFMRYVLPSMVERGTGRVVNIASSSAWRPFPHFSSYATAKAGLIRLTETASLEVAERGVRTFAISPGAVKTALMDYTNAELNRRGQFGDVLGSINLDFVPPTFAAELIVALASGKADALTGRYFTVHDDLPALIAEVTSDPSSERGHLRIVGG